MVGTPERHAAEMNKSKNSKHLAGAAEQEASDGLFDILVAEDAGRNARLDVVVQLRGARELLELGYLLLPVAETAQAVSASSWPWG